jgi:hypothetical protein
MLPRRLRATYREMSMPQQSNSSSTDSSSHEFSSGDEGVFQPLHEAPLLANHDQAMDHFMVDWLADDQIDDMFANPYHEPANVNIAYFLDIAQGQWHWHEAKAYARTPIFYGARLSCLATILGLRNIQGKHQENNTMLSDIFQYCNSLLLPEENVLQGYWKEAKKVLSSIGMEYEIVHVCINDCMLFHKNHANFTKCSICEEARYDLCMIT